MTLKTLKDLAFIDEKGSIEVDIAELKKEAIKWVKHLIDKRGLGGSGAYDELWIRHFFNITENDLK